MYSAEATADILFDGINDAPTIDTNVGSTQVENVAVASNTVATFIASDLEGDDIIYVNGSETLFGSGMEDAYNGGYYFNHVVETELDFPAV